MKWASAAMTLALKDIRTEFRTRETIASMLVFSILVIVLFSFAFSGLGSEATLFAPGALWATIVFSSMIGLARSFSIEEFNGCLRALLLCPHDRSVIFAGKLIGAAFSIIAVSTVALVLFFVLFNLDMSRLWMVWLVMLFGIIGISAAGVVFSAMTIGTRLRQTLLPVLVLPVIMPLIVFGMHSTSQIMRNDPLTEILAGISIIILIDIVLTTVGMLVFEHVVID